MDEVDDKLLVELPHVLVLHPAVLAVVGHLVGQPERPPAAPLLAPLVLQEQKDAQRADAAILDANAQEAPHAGPRNKQWEAKAHWQSLKGKNPMAKAHRQRVLKQLDLQINFLAPTLVAKMSD